MKDTERRHIMAFTFTVTFNQNGELTTVTHDGTTMSYPTGFLPVNTPLASQVAGPVKRPVIKQRIPIDLELLVLEGDDPCITHNGMRY